MENEQLETVQVDNTLEEAALEAPEDTVEDVGGEETDAGQAQDDAKPEDDVATLRAKMEALEAESAAAKADAKQSKDKYAQIKGKAQSVIRVLKKQQEDGLLDDNEMAEAGVDAIWLDKGIDKDAVDEKLRYFDKQVSGNMTYFEERHGDVNDLIQSYAVLLRDDPSERAKLDSVPDAVVVDYILSRGKEVQEEVAELKGSGSALAVIRKLKKQLAEKENSPSQDTIMAKPKTSVKNTPAVVTTTGASSYYADL